jgi:hypothetical protein
MPIAAVHLSLTESGNEVVESRYRRDDPNQYTARNLPEPRTRAGVPPGCEIKPF